jgi:hypothetical protein
MQTRINQQVKDFTDKTQIQSIYLKEIEEFVKRKTGADKVVAFGATIRKAESVKGDEDQPVAGDVHVDYTTRRAGQLGQTHLNGEQFEYKRLLVLSNWRAFSPPPQDWPLAVCDARSVKDDEGMVNTLIYQKDAPDPDNLPPIPEQGIVGEGTIFPYRESHRWCYFSHMNRDELLSFKLNDSDHSRAWRTPHCSFFNSEQDAKPRESIEVRTCCYFK